MITSKIIRYSVGAVFILVGLAFAIYRLDTPGLYHDEILFVNAAIGGAVDYYAQYKIFGISLFTINYIGALKSWLHAPIFYLFGMDAYTLRVPAIVIGAIGGGLLCLAANRLSGIYAFAISAMLIFTNPTFIAHLRFDWGPTNLMFLCRGLLIFAALSWAGSRSPRALWMMVLAVLLGTFDKLNFLWFDYAFLLSIVVVYRAELRLALSERRYQTVGAFMVMLVVVAGFTWRAIDLTHQLQPGPTDWGRRLDLVWIMAKSLFLGDGVTGFVSRTPSKLPQYAVLGYAVLALLMSRAVWLQGKAGNPKGFHFLCVFLAGTFAAYLATPTAAGPHHIAVLLGLPQLLMAVALGNGLSQRGTVYRIAAAAALSLVLVGNVVTNIAQVRGFECPTDNMDQANYEAATFATQLPHANVINIDWGLGTHMMVSSGGRLHFVEAEFTVLGLKSSAEFLSALDMKRDNYLFARLPGHENFAGNLQKTLQALEAEHLSAVPVREFRNCLGQPMIQVLKIAAVPG